MKKIENKDYNKVNNKSFQTLTSESYELSNNIKKSSKFLSFINNSIKYKCLNNVNKLNHSLLKYLIKSF